MKKEILILTFLLYCFLDSSGQCSGETGRQTNLSDQSSGKICYTDTYDHQENNYISKYVVSGLDSLKIYTVRVDYLKREDSSIITVSITDEQNHDCRVRSIAQKSDYIALMVRENSFLDTFINKEDNYNLLFTIPDRDKPYIVLNHFQSFRFPDVYYHLNPINESYLQRHIAEARAILIEIKNRREDSLRTVRIQENTRTWIESLSSYKDSVIHAIEKAEKEQLPVMADMPMSIYLGQVADSLFSDFDFNETIPAPSEFSVGFKFLFNRDGYLEEEGISSSLSAGNLDSAWFYSTFFAQVKQQLMKMKFEVKKAERSYLRVIPELDTRADEIASQFQEARKVIYFHKEKLEELENEVGQTINATRTELEKYRTRVVNIPTIYRYTLRFKFLKRQAEWKVRTEKDDIVITENSPFAEPVTACLKDRFRESIYRKSQKTYRVTIYTAFVNEKQVKKCVVVKN